MDFTTSATSATFLDKRLDANRKFGSVDFSAWLLGHLKVQPGEAVLDVGCGTGAQTIPISKVAKSVSAFDISSESIRKIRNELDGASCVEAVVGDMNSTAEILEKSFAVKKFDLALSVYALYYADDWRSVLDSVRGVLKATGRCAVCAPYPPHGLVQLASRYAEVPAAVVDSITFGRDRVLDYFNQHFAKVETFTLRNEVSVPTADALITFYKATTYYNENAVDEMRQHVKAIIAGEGAFKYEKNSILIIGNCNA
jgi:ubiquinone/menaquinone biosynthesis C-methylase UbiE